MKKVLKALHNLNQAPLKTNDDKLNYVIASYLLAFLLVMNSFCVTWQFADLINTYLSLSSTSIKYIQISSAAILTVGVWG